MGKWVNLLLITLPTNGQVLNSFPVYKREEDSECIWARLPHVFLQEDITIVMSKPLAQYERGIQTDSVSTKGSTSFGNIFTSNNKTARNIWLVI